MTPGKKTYEQLLTDLEEEYRGKAEHYKKIGEDHLSTVYWGCATGVFYARCAWSIHRFQEVKKMGVPFDDAA